jgi:hypothetical protein
LGAKTAEDEAILAEFISVLGVFNIKVCEQPFTLASDIGHALGVGIESQLDGLPYNVRYSFDVCLAHGYL